MPPGKLTCALSCSSIPGFSGSEDCAALEQLLEGYDQQDQDQVSEVCGSPLFKYMDNDVSAPAGLALRSWGHLGQPAPLLLGAPGQPAPLLPGDPGPACPSALGRQRSPASSHSEELAHAFAFPHRSGESGGQLPGLRPFNTHLTMLTMCTLCNPASLLTLSFHLLSSVGFPM